MLDSAGLDSWAAGLQVGGALETTLASPSPWLRGREPHSGHRVAIRIFPAPAGAGLIYTTDPSFWRQQRAPSARQSFSARLGAVESIDICIGVGNRRARITHIEHINAAFFAMGIDNAIVLVVKDSFARQLINKRAVPILSTGTRGFIETFMQAGITRIAGAPRRWRTITERFEDVAPERGDRIVATPLADRSAPIRVLYHAGYGALGVEDRSLEIEVTPVEFLSEVAEARTMLGQLNGMPVWLARYLGIFAFATYGFGLGIDTSNTMAPIRGQILGGSRYGSPGEELVRHKIIDFLGAVALLGPLRGMKFEVTKSGHANDLRALGRLNGLLVAAEAQGVSGSSAQIVAV